METTFKSLNEMVTDRLRESILDDDFGGGQSPRQQAPAQRHGVSEIVIRETIRRLQPRGLAEIRRREGGRVSRLSVDEVAELYELRVFLKERITRRVVPNCSARDLNQALIEVRRTADMIVGFLASRGARHQVTSSAEAAARGGQKGTPPGRPDA